MDLKDVLYQMMQENTAAGQPTDLRVGTVTREEPLEITINPATSPLRRRQLCLTEPVIEKKIPVLAHRHRIQTLSHTHANSAGTTTTGLDGSYLGEYALVSEGADAALQGEDIVCWEDGKKLPVKDGSSSCPGFLRRKPDADFAYIRYRPVRRGVLRLPAIQDVVYQQGNQPHPGGM